MVMCMLEHYLPMHPHVDRNSNPQLYFHSKCTRINIHTITADGLQLVVDVPLYGRVIIMQTYRPVVPLVP